MAVLDTALNANIDSMVLELDIGDRTMVPLEEHV
jgi:hypothetical protein